MMHLIEIDRTVEFKDMSEEVGRTGLYIGADIYVLCIRRGGFKLYCAVLAIDGGKVFDLTDWKETPSRVCQRRNPSNRNKSFQR